MSVVDVDPITDWLIGLLEAGTSKQIGDHQSPDSPVFPYGVLHILDGTQFAGPPFSTPDADADIPIQVDSVGKTPKQARWMADRVRRTLLARFPNGAFQVTADDPEGYHVADRQPAGGPSVPIPEGNTSDRLWSQPERFTIRVTAGG